MKRLLATLPILVLLFAVPSKSDMQVFPQWKMQKCAGVELACYTFEQAKDILKIDLDMQLRNNELIKVRAMLEDLKKANEKLDDSYVLLTENLRLTKDRLIQKDTVLEDMTKKLSECLEDDSNNWIWWIVGSAAVAASFIGGVYLGLKVR